jgi:F0F1-type ATP synthase membrane subunit b/b'
MDPMLVIKALIVGGILAGVLTFFLKKALIDTTQGAVNRLNRETEDVRAKQAELNEKIKQASEELAKRRAEADALVSKMKEEAEQKAKEERDKILKKAREDGEEVIARAQKSKEDMRKAVEKDVELKMVDYTALVLKEILSEKTLPALNEALIAEFLDGVKGVDMSMLNPAIDTADVVTGLPVNEKWKNLVSEIINQKLNRPIKLNFSQDNKIISGMIVRFGSLTLNGSFVHILREKGAEIKQKVERGLLKF